ncbi:diguanylate phosphodiesterase [Citrobacter werkmanii]|uniref:EAL domain-containing protein n=1 Tax=Citrobacter sp. wls711 TaxID=2576425 RepID=UPI000BBD048B|nr:MULTISPECIES: EAL domain-containing protein [Citrobacter]ATF49294.1 diguanylate phosphodiesterase [Citrobacter werkmanii]TKU61127.1 EAL domain-containing protein [Citrobacter sp. wls711]HEE0119720.1 EAL domain-containing protein [Citrobacter gillenii]HEE0121806.1 EAL domain-containing protein [Citrobacter gillenii]
MRYHFIAEPMRDTTEKLLGVEMIARFTSETVHPLHSDFIIAAWNSAQKRHFMLEQIALITRKRAWFESNNLFCTLNLIDEMALLAIGDPAITSALHAVPCIALQLSERFLSNTACLNNLLINSLRDGPNALWLSNLGSGSVGASPLVSGHFDVVKIDRAFFFSQVEKPMFPVLIKNIREYCDRVVVEGLENARLIDELSHAGIWAVQGDIFPPVAFSDIEALLPADIVH